MVLTVQEDCRIPVSSTDTARMEYSHASQLFYYGAHPWQGYNHNGEDTAKPGGQFN